jgi:pyruvate formate lyase activating enzyme
LTNASSSILIGGIQKSSLIDYPEKISAIVFTQGCNFRCPYCHNPELLLIKCETVFTVSHFVDFLKTRIGKLDGVVITGGEPTLHKDLPEFIKQIKELGFCVKLDTNGTNPEMLQSLLGKRLIDYVAMDIKAPIEKYSEVVCTKVNTDNILKSIEILMNSNINYEFRTTVVKSQLAVSDFEEIGKMISGAKKYYLQRFLPTKTLNKTFLNQVTYSDEEFLPIIDNLKKYIPSVAILK